MPRVDALSTIVVAVLCASACGPPSELPVLVFDTRSALCIDQRGDGTCDREFTVSDPVQPLRSDYQDRISYVLVGAISLNDGSFIELHTPGASLESARDVGGGTVLTYSVSTDLTNWPTAGKKVHIAEDSSTHVGGDGPTHTAWVSLSYRYSPQAFRVADLQAVQLQVVSRVQVDLPDNALHNDDRPVVYGGRVDFDVVDLIALSAGMGPDNTLHLDTDPLLLERWLDGNDQPVDNVQQLAISVLR